MRGSTFNVAGSNVKQYYYVAAAAFIVVIAGIIAAMAVKNC
jgi:hypothetical protein